MDAERLSVYLRTLAPEPDPFMAGLRENAVKDRIPVIRPETEAFLRTLVHLRKPQSILEVGTAVGYSALAMWEAMEECCPGQGRITTIENYGKRIPAARRNFRDAGAEAQITLLEGDAQEILPALPEPFDLIFLDAAKGQYPAYLPELLRLMRSGSVLVTDNVLQDGTILESRYAVPRRDRTIHRRMREYLAELTHTPFLSTAVLPVGDGVALTVRKDG